MEAASGPARVRGGMGPTSLTGNIRKREASYSLLRALDGLASFGGMGKESVRTPGHRPGKGSTLVTGPKGGAPSLPPREGTTMHAEAHQAAPPGADEPDLRDCRTDGKC